jgi:hypothetical protein
MEVSMTIQISNFNISDHSKVAGSGKVSILPHRKDVVHSGVFGVRVDVHFDPAVDAYPVGTVMIDVDLSDSFKGVATSTLIEQINSFGKHTPTSVISGRCKVDLRENAPQPQGCGFWLYIANNKKPNVPGTQDVVGFVIYDRKGDRVAYGTGPLDGDIVVDPTGL